MQYDNRPPHQRIHELSVEHNKGLIRTLWREDNVTGWDTSRDERTSTKEALVSYIRATWSAERIDAAHRALVASYDDNKRNGRGKRTRRGKWNANGGYAGDFGKSENTATETHTETNGAANGATMNAHTETHTATATATDGEAEQKLRELLGILGKGSVNADQVRELVRAEIAANKSTLEAQITEALNALKIPRAVTLTIEDLPPRDVGTQHKNFELLLKACHARLRGGNRLNIWLYGPAGTGKTTAAENVAEALGLPFYCVGTLSASFELIGYKSSTGEVQRTPFREAFECGGIFLFDEIDSSDPRAGLALNSALANGICAFPDKIVKRHKDCVIIAGANTTGLGSSIEYVGRTKQDAAFLNRFVKLAWPLDEALESAMCANASWLNRVRQVRANVKARGVKGVMVSPRASVYGEALLAAGIDQSDVEDMVLRGGLDDAQWGQIR